MKKHIKRIPIYLIATVITVFLIVWGAALVQCEFLTDKYYEIFDGAYQSNTMIGPVEYYKVLKCDGKTAEVYYISSACGNVLEFENKDGNWTETSWKTVWSKNGSASGTVWPYWWQFFITGA